MKLQAKVQLSLPSVNNTIELVYNTYERVTYDRYLATAILVNAKDLTEAYKYIDDITGKGALNPHLKNLIEKISSFDERTRNIILEESKFPIKKIDNTNHYEYFPYLDISKYKNKTYIGDLKKLTEAEILSIMNIKFDVVELRYKEKNEEKSNVYKTLFLDDDIKVNINDEFYSIRQDDFRKSYINIVTNISDYKGLISDRINGDNWNSLTESLINNIKNASIGFYLTDGNHYSINDDYIRKIEVVKLYDIYFYRETTYSYDRENSSKIKEVLDYLFCNNSINEVKTKILLKIMNALDEKGSQKLVNYILLKKDSKDIAIFGLKLIKSGLNENWELKALIQIKKYTMEKNLNDIYKISKELEYTPRELTKIDDDLLSDEHKASKAKYLSNRKKIEEEIHEKIGEITNSGIREKLKELPQIEKIKIFGKKLNKMIGHKKGNIADYTDDELSLYLEEVRSLFSTYQEIILLIDSRKLSEKDN